MKSDTTDDPPTDPAPQTSPPNTPQRIEIAEPPVGGLFGHKDEELPFPLRRSTFDLYEPYIAQAIRTASNVEVNPSPRRATTFAARLRDAIQAKERFNWPASFTLQQLKDADLIVKHGEQTVIIGPRALNRKKGRTPGHVMAFSAESQRLHGIIIEGNITLKELEAFGLLLSNKHISGPVIIKSPVPDSYINVLESNYDVAISKNSRNETIIL